MREDLQALVPVLAALVAVLALWSVMLSLNLRDWPINLM